MGSALAFTTALVDRAHIRIELFHLMLPLPVQMALNWLSIVTLAAFGGLLAWVCLTILEDSFAYNSTAPTPWATPLIYPQSLWYAGIVIFAVALQLADIQWTPGTGLGERIVILSERYCGIEFPPSTPPPKSAVA